MIRVERCRDHFCANSGACCSTGPRRGSLVVLRQHEPSQHRLQQRCVHRRHRLPAIGQQRPGPAAVQPSCRTVWAHVLGAAVRVYGVGSPGTLHGMGLDARSRSGSGSGRRRLGARGPRRSSGYSTSLAGWFPVATSRSTTETVVLLLRTDRIATTPVAMPASTATRTCCSRLHLTGRRHGVLHRHGYDGGMTSHGHGWNDTGNTIYSGTTISHWISRLVAQLRYARKTQGRRWRRSVASLSPTPAAVWLG
jgi:hypothetical protein